jgi:ABC-type multidrug transport system ATPase subunit
LHCSRRKEIEIPKRLGSAFVGALSSSRKNAAADVISFVDRLLEDKEERKKAISDSPIVAQALDVVQKLYTKRPVASLKVKDGSFKYIERFDKIEEEGKRMSQIETVYNGAPVQGLLRKLLRTLKGDFSGKETVEHFPIRNVNLFFEQGKTYLVLGAPRSGKSSLLKLIAGILPEDKNHSTGGTVCVNKITPKTQDFVWSNIVGYIDQIDRLHPYLTVKETCDFAWQCRSGGTHRNPLHTTGPEADEQIRRMDAEGWLVKTVLESMGLTRVKDTFVGDQQTVRGVSGGEKKRVTVSEMSVGRFPILCMDEISTGLDGRCRTVYLRSFRNCNFLFVTDRIILCCFSRNDVRHL